MRKTLSRIGSALLSVAVSLQIFMGTTGWEGLSLTTFAVSGTVIGPYTITGGSRNIDYKLEDNILYILTDLPISIKNTDISKATNVPIIVNANINADITLAGVNIAPSQAAAIDVSPATQSKANVTITLADDTVNTLKGGKDSGYYTEYDEENSQYKVWGFPGLQKNGGYISENEGKLIIQGENKRTGELITYGGCQGTNDTNETYGGPGIGSSGIYKQGIRVEKGDVDSFSTGVSNIYIDNCIVTAYGGTNAAGIGTGGVSFYSPSQYARVTSKFEYIYIYDSEVTAYGGSNAACIGTGYTEAKYNLSIYPSIWAYAYTQNLYVKNSQIQTYGGTSGIGLGATSAHDGIRTYGGHFEFSNSTILAQGGAGIRGGSELNMIMNNCTVTANGIIAGDDSNITITGGTVVATGNGASGTSRYPTKGGAGIAVGKNSNITITDGIVIATGGGEGCSYCHGGAGIRIGSNSVITITGGTVTATGAAGGAGIGGNYGSNVADMGTVSFENASVKATGGTYGSYIGAAIGTGGTERADGTSVLPKNEAGENLYLVTIPNPNGNPILIDGEEYPITKHADDDLNVYAYLADGFHVITVDGIPKGCDARTGLVLEIPVVTPPTAKTNLVYNGSNQALINAGSTTGGTMVYSLAEDGVYSATIPQGMNAGDYNVWYKVKGNDVYGGTKPQKIAVKIKQVTSMTSAQIAAVTVSSINYGQSLADSTITATASVPGTFQWEDSSIAPTGADSEHTIYNVIFTPTDTTNHTSHTIGVKIKVIKLAVPISEPIKQTISASGITYGQQLSNSILTGDVPRPGHYEWKSPTTRPSVSDSNTTKYPVLFVPDDPNYETVELSCSLAVAKKAFTFAYDDIAQLTTGNLVYGQTLSNSTISGPKPVAGAYRWKNGTIKPTVNGTNNYEVEFVPTDTSNYAVVLVGNVHVNVSKADPIITAAQIAGIRTSELTYGQSLSDSTIAAVSTTPGTFAWTNGIIVPTVADSNVTDFSITFTPTDTANYNTKTVSTKVKVNKGTITLSDAIKQSVSASTITYGQTLADSTITGNIPQAGHFEWQNPTTKPSVSDSGVTKYAVVFVPDNPNYLNVDMTLTLTVNKKAVPFTLDMVAQVSASNLIYGQTLADSTLTGNTPISGRYRWLDSSIKPAVNGTNKYAVEFVPTDSINYATVIIGDVHVTVNKADPIMTAEQLAALTTSELTYGQALADSIIMASATTPGTFKWTNEAIVPTVADSMATSYSITFTPTDTNNYNARTLNAKVKVNKAPVTLTSVIKQSVVATPITYGQALSASTLSGSTPMTGHYEWKTPTIKPTVSDSNLTQYTVLFVPDDDNYSSTEMTLSLTVNKKAFTFTPSEVSSLSASSLTYGQSLSTSTIVGNTPVAGSYRWKNDTIVPTVMGTNNYSVEFVPDDTDNYAIVTVGDVHVTVMKADPVITAEEIAAITTTTITYGQSLSNSAITGTTTLPGSFTWVNGAITPSVSDSNVTKYDVLFTPDDSDNYNTKTVKTTVKVNKAPVVISDTIKQTISTTGIVYGQTLADSIISGDVPQAGHYEWKDAAIAPAVADSNSTRYHVVFIPTDTNYANTELTITVPVSKKAFGLSDFDTNNIVSSSLVYGQMLSESNLIGNTPVAGCYRWADGTIVPTVTNTTGYEVEFVPNDTNNYEVVTAGNVRVSVSKAYPVVTDEQLAAIVATSITYGQTLASSTVTGTASVAGSFEWTDTTIAPSVSDSEFTKYDLTFTPADTDNYNSITIKSTIKVNKAPVVISDEIRQSITATGITYEDALADSVLSGNVPMPGHYEWKTPAIRPTVADSNVTQFEILFVPDDINYADTELTTALTVSKKAIVFSESDTAGIFASGITYGQTLADSAISGNKPQAGHYEWKTPTICPTVADSNTTDYDVIFIPDDDENYTNAEFALTLEVSKKAYLPADFTNIQTSSIGYGQSLANSNIIGNAPIQGSFKWVDEDIIPTISGTNNYAVRFIPTDVDNYEVVSVGDVHVSVNTADLTVTGTGVASGTYGEALNQFTVSGLTVEFEGAEINGSWSLAGTGIPNIPDSNSYIATFTPNDNADRFNTLTTNVSLSITADLIISPTNSGDELIYGVDYTYEDTTPRQLIILSSKPITIRNADPNVATSDTIKIAKDVSANLTLAGVNIDGTCAIEIEEDSTGDVTITLADGTDNILKSGTGHAGIEKNGNSDGIGRLTINGTGSLTVQGGENAAGIGGGNGKSTANIIIDNGNINTIGGANGAGIGGGANGNGTDITVNNGTVIATGGINGAGIGGGNRGNGENIIINNGTVNTTGGENGAGIGGGNGGNGLAITINDGNVNATGGTNGAGIGGGANGDGENITINDGDITATGGENGAGIGGGQNGHGKNISLAGGDITATGGTNAAGIGGGSNGNLETLVITGGNVITIGGSGGAGIGGGANGTAADISITGGNISAKGGSYTEDGNIYTGAAIGNGIGRIDGVLINGIPAEITNGDIITHLLTINAPTDSTIIVDGQTIVTSLPNIGLLLEEPGPHTVTTDDVTATYIWSDHNNKWMIIPDVTAPTAKSDLKYNGNAQELITAGSTTGGTLEYSLAETEGYSTSIPTGTQANTYTVWYRVVGNDDYTDVAPASIQVTISRKSSSGSSGGSSGGSSEDSSWGSSSGSSSAASNPLLNDKSTTWNSIADEISKFNKGTSATISMNGETIIPSKVVKAINDTDSKITFKLDGVFSWLIDGADINSNEPIDLSINRISGVPTTGVDGIVGTQIKLNNNAVAGIDLGINFKKEYDNQFANLYKQTSEGLEFVTCSKICNTGYVLLEDVKYAGNYVVMISQFSSKSGDINGDGFINAKDALAVLKHAVGIEAVRDTKMADVNHDGYINAKDALKILKVAIGLETM